MRVFGVSWGSSRGRPSVRLARMKPFSIGQSPSFFTVHDEIIPPQHRPYLLYNNKDMLSSRCFKNRKQGACSRDNRKRTRKASNTEYCKTFYQRAMCHADWPTDTLRKSVMTKTAPPRRLRLNYLRSLFSLCIPLTHVHGLVPAFYGRSNVGFSASTASPPGATNHKHTRVRWAPFTKVVLREFERVLRRQQM